MSIALMLCTLFAADTSPKAEWRPLLVAGESSPWQKVWPGWIATDQVSLKTDNPKRLQYEKVAGGPIWVNGSIGRVPNLITKEEYQDCEVHVEFLIAKGSNSGIKFHGHYEIQILDTADEPADKLSGNDCGGIYPRASGKGGYHYLDKGVPPLVNAAKPAGQWQTLDATFRAPRFDATGKKIENARLVKATLNGKLIHDNAEFQTPTGAKYIEKEVEYGPFLIQGDHGPAAFRNVKIRAITTEQ